LRSRNVLPEGDRGLASLIHPLGRTFVAERSGLTRSDRRCSDRIEVGAAGGSPSAAVNRLHGSVDGRQRGGTRRRSRGRPRHPVLLAAGGVPNVELAVAPGLDRADCIIADGWCRSSDPRIFAIGDCVRRPVPRTAVASSARRACTTRTNRRAGWRP